MRRAALLSLLVCAAAACLWSLLSTAADVLAWQAGRIGAPGHALALGGKDDQARRRLLGLAQCMDPANADYREQLAQHLERLALQTPPRDADTIGLLREAHRLNIQAAAQRPTWPLGLTSVLRTGLKLGRLEREFTRRYARAADLGRSEPAALRALVDLGLAAWPVLGPDGRREVQGLLRHGLRLDPSQVLGRALAWRQGALVEPLLASDAALQRLYADLRARSGQR